MDNQKDISCTARVIAVHKERYQLQITESGKECFGRLKASVYYHDTVMAYPVTGDIVSILPNNMGGRDNHSNPSQTHLFSAF